MPDYPSDNFIAVTFHEKGTPGFTIDGKIPELFAGNPLRCRVAFFKTDGQLADVSKIRSAFAQIEVKTRDGVGLAIADLVGTINTALTIDEWNDRESQHAIFYFNANQTELEVEEGETPKEYFLVFYGTSEDHLAVDQPDTFGWTRLQVYNDGIPSQDGPLQGGNIIPSEAEYDGDGVYLLGGLTAGKMYRYTINANDTNLLNPDETGENVNTSRTFTASSNAVRLVGTPNAPVTAIIWAEVFATVPELDQRYSRGIHGSVDIPNEAEEAEVTGLSIPWENYIVIVSIAKENDALNLFATVRYETKTDEGFICSLSGQTDSANYKLYYSIFPI